MVRSHSKQSDIADDYESDALCEQIRTDIIEVFSYTYYEPNGYLDDIANLTKHHDTNADLLGQMIKDSIQ